MCPLQVLIERPPAQRHRPPKGMTPTGTCCCEGQPWLALQALSFCIPNGWMQFTPRHALPGREQQQLSSRLIIDSRSAESRNCVLQVRP